MRKPEQEFFQDFEAPVNDQDYKDIYEMDSSEEIIETVEVNNSPPKLFQMKFNWNATNYNPYEPSEIHQTNSNYSQQSYWNPRKDPIHYESPSEVKIQESTRYTGYEKNYNGFKNTNQEPWNTSFVDPFGSNYSIPNQIIKSSPLINEQSTTRTMPLHMLEVTFKVTPITKPIFNEVKETLKYMGCRIKMLENKTLLAIFKSTTDAQIARNAPNEHFILRPLQMRIAGTSENELLQDSQVQTSIQKSESTYSYF